MSDKVNKFKVGDVVEIVSLNKSVRRFGGIDYLLPIGSISRIKYVSAIDEVSLQDGFRYDTADLKLANKETINSSNEPIKKTLYSPLTVQQAGIGTPERERRVWMCGRRCGLGLVLLVLFFSVCSVSSWADVVLTDEEWAAIQAYIVTGKQIGRAHV